MTSRILLALSLSIAAASVAHAQSFIASNRTIAGGNPLNGNYNGSPVYVGASGYNASTQQFVRVPNLTVDITDPGQFSYSDQTGGGVTALSNSVLNISGGTFGQITSNGFGGGLGLGDTSQATITGGTIQKINVNGTAAGIGGAHATLSGGLIENGKGIVATINNGILDMVGGTIRSTGGQPGLVADTGSIINFSGGLATSVSGTAIAVGGGSIFTMTGGTASAGAGNSAQRAFTVTNATVAAALSGGTINGGFAARRNTILTALEVQANISGSVAINGGVVADGSAAVNIYGGAFTGYAGDASFLTLGSNNINFFGSNLALSAPTAGSIFYVNNIAGNFYTFTSGVFRDGQSAVGLRLFDATSLNGNTSGFGGGYTLNQVSGTAAPEPGSITLLALSSLPVVGRFARRRRKTA